MPRDFDVQASHRAAGIPGTRFLDGGSRKRGEGTRNYVTFAPSIMEIARETGRLVRPETSTIGAARPELQKLRSLLADPEVGFGDLAAYVRKDGTDGLPAVPLAPMLAHLPSQPERREP